MIFYIITPFVIVTPITVLTFLISVTLTIFLWKILFLNWVMKVCMIYLTILFLLELQFSPIFTLIGVKSVK